MSSAFPTIPTGALPPVKVEPKPQASSFHTFVAAPKADAPTKVPALEFKQPEHHHSVAPPASPSTALSPTALSSQDVSYVQSLMGVIPAQKMEEILLKTGVPVPVNLGPTFDASV